MNFSREYALKVLNIKEGFSREELDLAFQRMIRRYQPRSFPERFHEILQAKDLLSSSENIFQTIAKGKIIDLSWLIEYLPDLQRGTSHGDSQSTSQILDDLLRAGLHDEEVMPKFFW